MDKKSLYLATITVLLTGISLSTSVFADTTDTTDEIGIEIPISCTMSGTGTNSHYASIPNGIYSGSYTDPSTNTNYANGIGTTTITAFCNDNQGFSIYAIGYTDNVEGKTVLSNSTLGSTNDIVTGTATGPVNNNDVSNWSMKLSTTTSPTPTYPILIQNSFDSYHELPSDYTLVAKRESATDVGQNAVGSTLTTTYAAYISKTQPSGLYEGQVKYTMVHPYDTVAPEKTCPQGNICYYPNSSSVLGRMSNQELMDIERKDWNECGDTDFETFCYDVATWNEVDIDTLPDLNYYVTHLMAPNYHRDGYGFAGWNTSSDYTGINYGPNEAISVPVNSENGFSLYAIWVESSGNLQGFTTTQCDNMNINQVIALTDIRDNQTYSIAKLPDNNCWMIENLRLSNVDSNNNAVIINSINTNNPASSFTSLPSPVDPSQNAWCAVTPSGQAAKDCTNQPMISTTNIKNNTVAPNKTEDTYAYGVYYNWYSATAGNGTYEMTSGNTDGDICPNGWRLPVGGSASEFLTLNSAIENSQNINNYTSYPINIVYSGYIMTNSTLYRGIDGDYRTSTPNGAYHEGTHNAYTMGYRYSYNPFYADYLTPSWSASNVDKMNGITIRCLLK